MFKELIAKFIKTQNAEQGNRSKGAYGEKLALKYLKNKGYKLVEKNYRVLRCEIDIIVKYDKTLVFVEVKSRTNSVHGSAAEAVDFRKQNNIKKAAQAFLNNKRIKDLNVRFDVVEVDLKTKQVNHIENAFY